MRLSGRRSRSKSAGLVLLALAVAWIGNLLYAAGAHDGALKFWSSVLVAVAMTSFVLLHGSGRYGGRMLFRFFLIVFAVGWTFETISVLTGFPFGDYHYTDAMAPFIWHVPVTVLPAYAVMGYASWSLACLLCGERGRGLSASGANAVPILGAVLMVVWDLSMDPLRASVESRWIWADGGAYFGVPLHNYFGWLLVTWLMFRIFAQFLVNSGFSTTPLPRSSQWWLAVPLFYLAFAAEYLVNPLTGHGLGRTISMNGEDVVLQAVYVGVALVTLMTMVPMAVLGILAASGAFRRSGRAVMLARAGNQTIRPQPKGRKDWDEKTG